MDVNCIPKSYRGIYDRAMTGRSQAAAIRAHCLMCIGWQREEVKFRTARDCPCYPYRLTGRKPKSLAPPAPGEHLEAETQDLQDALVG
ncbi:MAG: hypothetical protein JSV78_10250 [Phycisphaerales bacterium]|nr:MAG: hypothetical protein JSV78_10250 [Phycisphaerales bacterium]